ncbi:hypothetical protein LAZ67_6003445 [Cordylochernes scorpioides]|uniref:Transposase n=1 Tax=Cordylochernes scorpioides TaxID=51811 RepID=A0ABY6KP85_9ARAC|nr:hypothetical protein LAZ67_6003445 [Cordylochernes scorpioides]
MLQKAFKDDCISRSQSGKWHKAFKEGREEVADEPRSGRPTTARTDEDVDRVLEELLDLIQNEPDFLNSVVTGDESWMFEYDPESKRQSCAWHTKSSLRPKKARMSKSRIKTMIIVFFDIRGIVHCEFVPQGQTVNSAFYLEVLRRLKRRIARVRTNIKDTVKIHHDNATSHTAFIITNFLAQSNIPESLRDRFVAGIIDTSTQKKLLQEEGLNFDGALDIALSAESADNDLHNIKRSENAHQSPQHLHAINNACKHCEEALEWIRHLDIPL